jgi:hypothetical protein
MRAALLLTQQKTAYRKIFKPRLVKDLQRVFGIAYYRAPMQVE